MIAVVVYNLEECAAAKGNGHDLVIFVEQPGIVIAYPLFRFAEFVLERVRVRIAERYPFSGFLRHRFPYDYTEFVYSLVDETSFLDLLREVFPNIEIRNWRRVKPDQLSLLGTWLCFSCDGRENCGFCISKIKPK